MTIKKIGKYIVLAKIGQGGMGAIFKAKHPTLQKILILKQLTLHGNMQVNERFKREARIMIDLRNDHIVQVFDHFKEGHSYFIAMEFIDGISLEKLLEQKRYLSNDAIILIVNEICKALYYAHKNCIIHRDIKPGNILISKKGEIKLTDFGIARSTEGELQALTRAGMSLGTPSYMSPEQIIDSKSVTNKADIYSLGVMIYEMATGKLPFPGTFTPEANRLIEKGIYTDPKKINPNISPLICTIIKKAMHKKVRRRYNSAENIKKLFTSKLKYLKNQNSINNLIEQYINGKEINIKSAKKIKFFSFKNLIKKIPYVLSIIAIAGGIYYAGIKLGYLYEFIFPSKYGAVNIELRLMKKHKQLKDYYINSELFCAKDADAYILEKHYIHKLKQIKTNHPIYYILQSDKIYLEENNYKLNIYIENKKHHESFYLHSRKLQKKNDESYDGKNIVIYFNKSPVLPLTIDYSVRDRINQKDITYKFKTYIYINNKWKNYKKYYEDNIMYFTSGRNFQFKFVNKNYFDEIIKLGTEPYQSELNFTIDAVRLPANLLYKSDEKNISVMLNNSDTYISGSRYPERKKIETADDIYEKMLLAPGLYYFTARKAGRNSKTIEIDLNSNQYKYIDIKYDNKNKKINFSIK